MKKVLALILALCMMFTLAACGNEPAASTPADKPADAPAASTPADEPADEPAAEPAAVVEPYEFHFSYGGNANSSMVAIANLLMEELDKASNGAFTFNTYNDPGYKEKQALDELMNDLVDIVYLASGSVSTTISEVAYLGMPGSYRYTDDPELFYSFEETVAPILSDIYDDYGIHYLALRVPTKMAIAGTGEPVTTPADLQGKICRVAGTWLGKLCVSLDIGTATLGGSEIVTGLQRGTIDACLTGAEQINTNLVYEASDYCSIFPETDGIGAMVMDAECWNKLTDAQKAAVEVAIENWVEGCLELSASFYQQTIDKCNEYNVPIVEISDEECDEWLVTIDQVYAEIDAGTSEKGIQLKDAILAWRAAN